MAARRNPIGSLNRYMTDTLSPSRDDFAALLDEQLQGRDLGEGQVVHGRVVGRVRGLKVRLSATARVEGDIVHKTIAIESGAHFEGSVQRQEDPLTSAPPPKLAAPRVQSSS